MERPSYSGVVQHEALRQVPPIERYLASSQPIRARRCPRRLTWDTCQVP